MNPDNNDTPEGHADLDPTVDSPELTDEQGEAAMDVFGETMFRDSTDESGDPVEAQIFTLPEKLGRYVVRESLGEGGFGAVYRGYDEQLDRDVAIKVPRPMKTGSKDAAGLVATFLEEARSLARLKHPGIVTVLEVGEVDGSCMIVSEFLDGPDLNDWMKEYDIPWQQAIEITAHVADALGYAHAQSTVHRDMKPANIILVDRSDGMRPVLVDFGLAISEMLDRQAQVGVVAGTPNYMSPEQASGRGHRIDGRTDIYSLGVVLYRMLCGSLPFAASSANEILRRVREDVATPPRQINREIPQEAERICLKAMSREIVDRYTTANDMATDLRALLARRPSVMTDTVEIQPLARAAVRRQVSVLVCRSNLFDLPTFIEQLEPEEQHGILLGFQQMCEDAVAQFGGAISQFDAECTTVCFGYPVAHEDAGRRAVGAGLRILASLADLSHRLKSNHNIELIARAGVHTADAVLQENSSATSHSLTLVGKRDTSPEESTRLWTHSVWP